MIAQVALPLPIPKTFTYRVPPDLEPFVTPRVRVKVPFAKRSLIGFVIGIEEDQKESPFVPTDISEVIDLEPVIDSTCFNLCSWAAHHYCAALGLALKASFPPGVDLDKYLMVVAENEDLLKINRFRLKRAYRAAGKEKVWQYYNKGLLQVRDVFTWELLKSETVSGTRQAFSATLLRHDVEARREYYLSLARPVLESGSNVLVLLPDHGLAGGYFLRFFRERLGDSVLEYGSQVPARRRGEIYLRIRKQGGYLVVGTRSCLFLPADKTGLIIVERPEDDGYRNDQTLQFNAVALAGKLAELQQIPICYGSVSPPLELMKGLEEGSVSPIGCESEKKSIDIARIKRFRMGDTMPPELADLLVGGFARDERIVIHTPLKDYASRLYCLSCRRAIVCPVCDTAVSLRKEDNRLSCWRCGRQSAYHEHCSRCGSDLIGFGSTGAEYIEEHIKTTVPDAHVVKITGDVLKDQGADQLISLSCESHTIIVGTQILSKFYELGPIDRLILLGWEDFLRIAGYRAKEYMHQTYCNLVDALRPARIHLLAVDSAKEPAEVLAMSSEDFYKEELKQRKTADFPPYLRLFLLKVDAPNKTAASSTAQRLRTLLEEHGLRDHIIGETMRPGERGRLTMLIKGKESLPEDLIHDLGKVRHVRIEADPPWV
jgi:primosomal protein N' (replication factor Y)